MMRGAAVAPARLWRRFPPAKPGVVGPKRASGAIIIREVYRSAALAQAACVEQRRDDEARAFAGRSASEIFTRSSLNSLPRASARNRWQKITHFAFQSRALAVSRRLRAACLMNVGEDRFDFILYSPQLEGLLPVHRLKAPGTVDGSRSGDISSEIAFPSRRQARSSLPSTHGLVSVVALFKGSGSRAGARRQGKTLNVCPCTVRFHLQSSLVAV